MKSLPALAALSILLPHVLAAENARTPEAKTSGEKGSAGTLYLVPYSHLDTQWLWDYPRVIRDYLPRTLEDNFALIEKHPDYIFNFSGSRRYRMFEEYYPELFPKVVDYARQGRWFPCGSSVDEVDVNMPSLESFVRSTLYGNRYFRNKLGVASDEFMLPDCFGFTSALPSMMAHCGLRGFSTQKLTWGAAVDNVFWGGKWTLPDPGVGVWRGPDGSEILVAMNARPYDGLVDHDLSRDADWISRVKTIGDRTGFRAEYHYYGTGDQGGAPAGSSVEWAAKSQASDGPLAVRSSRADEFFKAITPEQFAAMPRYEGEFLLTEHSSGCLTSQAAIKRWNRMNENLADAAERAAAAADWLGGAAYPHAKLEDAWHLVLGSQMHDILPGTSIPKAYEYAWNDATIAMKQFADVVADSLSAWVPPAQPGRPGIVVFNPVAEEREELVHARIPAAWIPGGGSVTATRDDNSHDAQVYMSAPPPDSPADGLVDVSFRARVPSLGFACYTIATSSAPASTPAADAPRATRESGKGIVLENTFLRVRVSEAGEIASIVHKATGREALAEPVRLVLLAESPRQWPAWNMDWDDRQQPPAGFLSAAAESLEPSPADAPEPYVRIRHRSADRDAAIVQQVVLRDDQVVVHNTLDWFKGGHSLKASVRTTVANPMATYERQVGVISRPTNHARQYEVPSANWMDLSAPDGSFGLTLLNDCKYGSDKPDASTLRLTLAYTPRLPNCEYGFQASQDFGRHEFSFAIVPHAGDWRAARAPSLGTRFNQPLRVFASMPRSTTAATDPAPTQPRRPGVQSFLSCDSPDVGISAVKKAEGGGAVIVRIKELHGATVPSATLAFAAEVLSAREVDGQERDIGPATVRDGRLVASLTPWKVSAYAVTLATPAVRPAPATTAPVVLPHNWDVVSTNANRRDGNMNGSRVSIPAELLAPTIVNDGIPFAMGDFADGGNNVTVPRGQSIALPPGDFDEVRLLVADTDATTFRAPKWEWSAPNWTGYMGQWDNRIWEDPDKTLEFNWRWPWAAIGLRPGYIQTGRIARYGSHIHGASGDQPYRYFYISEIALPHPADGKLPLPKADYLRIFSATCVKRPDRAILVPAAPLHDTLADRAANPPAWPHGRFAPPQPTPSVHRDPATGETTPCETNSHERW